MDTPEPDHRPVVIELYAGPGAGKSTLAAGLFSLMKTKGYRVELVTELAKDITYEKAYGLLQNQFYVAVNQEHRQWRLRGQVDWIITDSPLPLGLAYCGDRDRALLQVITKGLRKRYVNLPILVKRAKTYQQYGRSQTENEARAIDTVVDAIFYGPVLGEGPLLWGVTEGNADAPHWALQNIVEKYQKMVPQ